ncbi:MAG TPA: serine/threonine-protein kinase [Thermoanaerobaculia bacterium]|nr:serine/threonine-protein kinase [Thermoanaerobaculia bacterium]
MTLAAGTRLGPYQILSPLGAGGMGEVYRAKDSRLGRDVAIKVLPPKFAADPDRLLRFQQEAHAVAALSHPNIVALYDVGSHEEAPFVVTELLQGETLKDRLAGGPLSPRAAVEIGVQIAHGLAAAHAKGVVHRDVKPANVFVTSDGVVKVLDFGLAKLVRPETAASPEGTTVDQGPRTESGTVLGTMGYISPEQLRGEEADARSDIFGFGCVLYEMLAGRSPFLRATGAETVTAIMSEDPPPLSGTGRAIAPALEEIVRRCLEKHSADRFSSAHDLALALRAQSGASAAPVTAPSVAPRPGVKKLWVAAAAGAALLAVVATVLLRPPSRRSAPALDPKRTVVATFENRTGDPALDNLGSLIVEALTRNATLAGGEAIVPATAFASKVGDRASVAALRVLAKENGAALLVSGAYYAAGEDLRIQAQLFDALQASLIATFEPVAGSRRAASSLLEPLRQRVLGAGAVHGEDAIYDPRIVHSPTLDSFVEFQRGNELREVDDTKALAHYSRASELDPEFMYARAVPFAVFVNLGRCEDQARVLADLESRVGNFTDFERLWVTSLRARYENRGAMQLRLFQEMEERLARLAGGRVSYGLRFERGNWEQWLNLPRRAGATYAGIPKWWSPAMGTRWWPRLQLACAYHSQREYETELKVVEESLREYPDVAYFYECKAGALAALGRLTAADRVMDERLAAKAEGTPLRFMNVAAAELRAHGHREASLRMAERAVAWFRAQPDAAAAGYRLGLLAALAYAERSAESKAIADALLAESPNDSYRLARVGSSAAHLGDTARARQVEASLRDRKEDCTNRGEGAFLQAVIAAQLGEKERAVALLRDAFAQGYPFSIEIHRDIDIEPLRGYRPFEELMKPKG